MGNSGQNRNRLTFILANYLMRRGSVLFVLILSLILIGLFTSLSYQNFLHLQAQNLSQLSIHNEIIKPLSGLTLLTQLIVISVSVSLLYPYFSGKGQRGVLSHSSLSNVSLFRVLFRAVFMLSLFPIVYFLLVYLSLLVASQIDLRLAITSIVSLVLASALFTCIALSISFRVDKVLLSLVIIVSFIFSLVALDEYLRNSKLFLSLFLDFYINMRTGLFDLIDFVSVLLWIVFFYYLAVFNLGRNRNLEELSVTRLISYLLVIISVQLFANTWLSIKPFDVTSNQVNSLDISLVEELEKIEAPIKITAVIDQENNYDEIRNAVNILKRNNENIVLEFSNSQSFSNQSNFVGEFIKVDINGHEQAIPYPFEQPAKLAISNLIIQLTGRNKQWITFIEGHGEASPFGKTNRDISVFYQSLKSLGWPIALQNLSKSPVISENTKLVVVAASKNNWLPVEVDGLIKYLEKGGNLLILREFDDKVPDELDVLLAIKRTKGVLIDWQGYQSGTPHPAVVIVNDFSSHSINTGIDSLLAFPWATGLIRLEQQDRDQQNRYDYQVIAETHKGIWNEINHSAEELSYNAEKGELQGVYTLGYSLENKANQQRVVVLGDSSFISDSAINNYANHQFGLNIISWLTAQKMEFVSQANQDNYISINPFIHFLFGWVFWLILPLLIAIVIAYSRYRNNHQNRKEIG